MGNRFRLFFSDFIAFLAELRQNWPVFKELRVNSAEERRNSEEGRVEDMDGRF